MGKGIVGTGMVSKGTGSSELKVVGKGLLGIGLLGKGMFWFGNEMAGIWLEW